MIKDSGKKLFDMIIVWKLDRFARNRYDSARYKAQLKKNGVKVVSATEVISDGAEGIILESMLEGFAEYYSVDLSEKVVRGMTDNALKCMFNGGTLPMGYQIDADQHFQIDPVTAPYILDAFKRYDEGATMTETGREPIQWDIPAAAKVPCFASQTAKKSGASDTRRRRRGWKRRGLR